MPKVKVDDIQIYYEVKGEGFPLVMINGLGGNLEGWDPRLVEGLSKGFKLVMFDNRGAGRTDISNREYTIRLFADDTAGLMNTLGISKAHILGISMGGMIAQELVLNYPEKVAKLVLWSTCSGGSKDVQSSKEVSRMLTDDTSKMSQEEQKRMLLPLVLTDDFIEKNPDFVKLAVQLALKHPISEEAYMRQLNAVRKFNAYDRLHQIKAPTLILHGRKDVLIPPENGSILAEAIPNAKLVYFEKSAHMLAEEMREVINVLIDFLD
jgi:pimeloyl-ACP methyl ester carboxylesterase